MSLNSVSLNKYIKSVVAAIVLMVVAAGYMGLGQQVQAQSITLNPGTNCDNASDSAECREIDGLGEIEIPIFVSFEYIQNFSPFSYIALVLNILFVAVTILWVALVIKAGVDYIRSQGDEGAITGANKQIGSVFASISILFVSFLLIILVGYFLNLGNFFNWPRVLSICDDGTFYITKALELEADNTGDEPLSDEFIGQRCFGGNGSSTPPPTRPRTQAECQIQCNNDPFYDDCLSSCTGLTR